MEVEGRNLEVFMKRKDEKVMGFRARYELIDEERGIDGFTVENV